MGGKEGKLFKKFEDYCTKAYNFIRKHSTFIINIFLMMLSAGNFFFLKNINNLLLSFFSFFFENKKFILYANLI